MKRKIKRVLLLIESAVGMTLLITAVTYVFLLAMERADGVETGRGVVSSGEADASPTVLTPGAIQEAYGMETPTPAMEAVLVLVNEAHPLPEGYDQTIVRAFDHEMDQRIVQPFADMREAARKEGLSLWVSSAYRSAERQDQLFSQAVDNNLAQGATEEEAEATAAISIARPGRSEHNTGLALDLNGVREDFGKTAEYAWLMEHAEEYGFVLRYPKDKQELTGIRFEPWHFRYVGVENAKEMNRLHMCLEEYVDYLKAGH